MEKELLNYNLLTKKSKNKPTFIFRRKPFTNISSQTCNFDTKLDYVYSDTNI